MVSSEQPGSVSIALGGSSEGQRLDRFLGEALGLSRSQVRGLLASGSVSLGGRTLGYGDKGLTLPRDGRLRVVRFRRPEQQRAEAAGDGGLRVLTEGSGWLAVDKPPGVPVHPLSESETGTVAGAVLARHPEMHGVGEEGLRSGVLHRLDVDTSGVLLFATEAAAWDRLRSAFREHRVRKTYRALVAGDFPEAHTGDMACDLAVARHRPALVRVVDAASRKPRRSYPARQRVAVLERFGEATLLQVEIETGFLHQIRVILAHLGSPVLGDALYGDEASLSLGAAHGIQRQMLHAAHLVYEDVEASSPDPEDFAAALAALRDRAGRRQEASET